VSIKLLKQNIESLQKQLKWLVRSYELCKSIGLKSAFLESEFDSFETLSGRFARTLDFLVRKVFRSLDDLEFESQGTLVDTVNNALKRNLITDINLFRNMRDLRNEIAHEYLEEELISTFKDLLNLTPYLIEIVNNTIIYANKNHLNE
jgi:hypothetical protein